MFHFLITNNYFCATKDFVAKIDYCDNSIASRKMFGHVPRDEVHRHAKDYSTT